MTSPHNQDHRSSSPYGVVLMSAGEVSPVDPKPRLRWTSELHERFVDAVTQLGGADSEFISSITLHASTLRSLLISDENVDNILARK